MAFITWFKDLMNTLYDEIFGEPVNYPLLRRLLAFAVDILLFYLFASLISVVLNFTRFNIKFFQVVVFEIIVGALYFSILNSKMGYGKTIGKRIFKLKVTDEHGEYIGVWRSLLRSFPLVLIINFYGIAFSTHLEQLEFIYIMYGLFIFFIGIVYFAIAKLNRQGLHDLIAGTQVVSKDVNISTEKNLTLGLVSGFILILAIVFYYFYLLSA